jgi:hypothetical protein
MARDKDFEEKHGFSMPATLERAQQTRLLAGLRFYLLDGVRPPRDEMRHIIEAGGWYTILMYAVYSYRL